MKRIFAVLIFLLMLVGAQEAFASKIPDNEMKVLKQTFKDLKVRFDGMVELPDGTNYIPVYPLQDNKAGAAKITQTIPKNKALKDKPDFFMFNTNFAFFKVIKNDKGKTTFVYNDSIPMDVKMGILPQDLLVPTGFEIPGELRILIGDLVIPIKPSKEFKEVNLVTGKEVTNSPRTKLVAQAAQQVANKYFYTTSFNQNEVNVLNADNGKAFKKIEFSSIPSDIKLSNDGKYLLVSTLKNGNIYVLDAVKSSVLKELKAGERASFIAISDTENVAYIANLATQDISVIDLGTMQNLDTLKVKGNPSYIEFSADGQSLYYLDGISGIVYQLTKQDKYFAPTTIKALFKTNNISKLQVLNNKIYTLDRGKNEMDIYYMNGKPRMETDDTMVNVSNIAEINKTKDSKVSQTVDYNYYNEEENKEPIKKSFKEKAKEKTKNGLRALLYYPEDDNVTEQPLNPGNQVQIITKDTSEYAETPEESDKTPKKKSFKENWKIAKNKFLNYMNYTPIPEETDVIEDIKIKVDKQMDFIKLEQRANDFAIINNKIYILASDDFTVYVYDANTNQLINTIALDEKGYYNSIRVSKDKSVGILTNITSKELTLFDVKTDSIIQKLPVSVNVHNVVITNKK